jgi:voltage-gated potassium channel
VAAANRAGIAAFEGDAASTEVLRAAGIEEAAQVVDAPHRDDNAVLMTLTARELNPRATIVAAVREQENGHLLRQSGADAVITTSAAAGRLLGLAVDAPATVTVLEDLLDVATGLDLDERPVTQEGELADFPVDAPVIAVVRDGEALRFDDSRAQRLQRGDVVICLCANEDVPT